MPATKRPRMSEAQVRRSLATWQKRRAYRHTKHVFYEQRSKRPRAERQQLAAKWRRLEVQARQECEQRRSELRWYETHKAISPRAKAVRHAQAFAGRVTEQPAGSNRGGQITVWEQRLGAWLIGQAWCGTFAANMLLYAGVRGVTARLASVALIEEDAKARRGCFRGWTTDPGSALPGDLVVLFGYGVHVELVVRVDRARSIVETVGGNTSAGADGSQANGGGVYARVRPLTAVRGFALVNFPG